MRKDTNYLLIGLVIVTFFFLAFLTNKALKADDDSENQLINQCITGRWVWEKNSEEHTFTVNIQKTDNYYSGTYFAVAENGMKIDGDPEAEPSFKIQNFNNNEVIVTFKTYFSGTLGKVKLRLENNVLFWEIIEEPEGEYYCPKVAILERFKEQ